MSLSRDKNDRLPPDRVNPRGGASVPNEKAAFGSGVFNKLNDTIFQKPYAASAPKDFEGKNMGTLDYGIGDSVQHVKFGVGIVTNINSGGKDYEVTVDFSNFGIKKMLASFAKLKKL